MYKLKLILFLLLTVFFVSCSSEETVKEEPIKEVVEEKAEEPIKEEKVIPIQEVTEEQVEKIKETR